MIGGRATISSKLWGTHEGRPVYLFKLVNAAGAYIELTNYGATLVSVVVPDGDNNLGNVVLGFPDLQGYLDDDCYIGSTVGRFANRIAGAQFTLDGVVYQLENNDGKNSNHGGNAGFNKKVFDYVITDGSVSFTILSKDGEGGYPGNLSLTVNYRWTDLNELIITYTATSDKKTIANFTNHAYFNLSNTGQDIQDHLLTIYADNILEADADYTPTGVIKAAGNKVFLNTPVKNNMNINGDKVTGLNDCYLLNVSPEQLKPAAKLQEQTSGRWMEVFTTYPALMLYTADYLHSKAPGHAMRKYQPFDGLCLECQHCPDSPNQPIFPSAVLNVGEVFEETIVYKFGTIR
ncbi:aldose 1-epimerase [Mucilaginibacter pineti]|uniref:Aldose 1-epimerase n=2 Tax=Mucilaginibacter pineti TaxID=1391627 RepID=A0A1G7D8G4_9SPHI|nr:aldose 1-epimerase [Mucilaginibacter pineti]